MYNFNFKISYKNKDNEKETDTIYREEILKAFNMEVFDTKVLVEKVTVLFNIFKNDFSDIFKNIKKRCNTLFILDDFSCFQILFSWEHFFIMHSFLEIYFNEKKIEKNIILNHLLNI